MSDEKVKKEGEEMFEEEEKKEEEAEMIYEEITSEEEEKIEVDKMKFLEYEGKEEIDIDYGIFVKDVARDVGGDIVKVRAKEIKGEVITLTDEDMSEDEERRNEGEKKEEKGTDETVSIKETVLKLSPRVVDLMTKEIKRYQVKRRPLGLVAPRPLKTNEVIKNDVEYAKAGPSREKNNNEIKERKMEKKEDKEEEDSMEEYIEKETSSDEEKEKRWKKGIVKKIEEKDFKYEGLGITENGRVIIEDKSVEVVKSATKNRYNRYLEAQLERVEELKEQVPRLRGMKKQFNSEKKIFLRVENRFGTF